MSATDRARRHAGFSLIEVMIAIAIMATLSLIAWRGLDAMTRSTTQLRMRTEETAQLMRVLQQIERDLAWRTTIELPDDRSVPRPPAAPAAALRVPLLPIGMSAHRSAPVPFSIEWVRAAPAAPGQWQRVRWWMQGGVLYRAAGEAAAAYPLPAPASQAGVAVANGVAAFDMRAWSAGSGWRVLPALDEVRTAASGIEVVLKIRRSEGAPLSYRRVIPLN
ncbi:MAG: prepilin-type N-terminal cleavage/methylation domain-containing protein [Rhodocyclaceae bacterium]